MSKNTQIGELINYISVNESGDVVLSNGHLVATQNYVSTAVANLVDAAPATLDTLNELAAALGDDPNFATTVTNSIGGKLSLTGGTLTGALNGTSATFTGAVTSQQSNISADGAGVVLQGYVDNILRIAVRGSGYNDGGRGGLLASTADFSSSVTAAAGINAIGQQKAFSWQRTAGTASDVYSLNADSGSAYLQNDTTSNILMSWLEGGNVGIGIASPTNGKLEIQQSTTTAALWVQTGGTSSSDIIADFRTGSNLPALQILGNGAATFGSSVTANGMTLLNSGGTYLNYYVSTFLIGRIGNVDTNDMYYDSTFGGNHYFRTGTGGTTSPTTKFTIASSGAISNDFSAGGTFAASFTNSNSTGYGLYVRGGSNVREAILIADNAGNQNIRLYGDGSATFSSTITSGDITTNGNNKGLYFNGTRNAILGNASTEEVSIATANVTRLTIASTGAATFNNSVSGNALSLYTSYSSGRQLNFGFSDGSVLPNAAFYIGNQTAQGVFIGDETTTNGLYVKANGNVGIGTTSPIYKLDVLGASGNITTDASNGTLINIDGGSITSTNFGVGIGFVRTGSQMAYIKAARENTSDEAGFLSFATQTAAGTHPERMRIDSSGNITYGVTQAYDTNLIWRTNFTGVVNGRIFATGAPRVVVVAGESNGVQLTSGATSWTSNSDERLKDINCEIKNAVEKLLTLRTVHFSWKADKLKKENLGLIAQDVEKQFPQLIDKGELTITGEGEQKDETEYLGIRYTELIPVLIKAIQELKAENDLLKARLDNNNIN
jgi:hypothetical protein